MRLVAYNILDGGTGRADPLAEVLLAQRPDVVVLPEAGDEDVTRHLAKRLRMAHLTGHGHGSSVAVLSRLPIRTSVNHSALDPRLPRACLRVDLESPLGAGGLLPVFGVHFHAKATLADERHRLAELEALLALTRDLRDAGTPHILAGDFNANSPHQRIDLGKCRASTRAAAEAQGGEIPRDVVATLERAGYLDTLLDAHPDSAPTAVSFTTHEPGQRVDYVFAFALNTAAAWIETDRLATYASDHYPVGAELAVGSES